MKGPLFQLLIMGAGVTGILYCAIAAPPPLPVPGKKTLKKAYAGYFPIGAAVGYAALTDSPGVAAVIRNEEASRTPDN